MTEASLQITAKRETPTRFCVTASVGDESFTEAFAFMKSGLRKKFARQVAKRFPAVTGAAVESELEKEAATIAAAPPPKAAPSTDELLDGITFWKDADSEPFCSFDVDGHIENWPVGSKPFARLIKGRYFAKTGRGIKDEEFGGLRSVAEGKACFQGEEFPTAIRICRSENGDIFLDLCNAEWHVIRITAEKWTITESSACPVKFLRRRGMLPLPCPVSGGNLNDLREILNVPDDESWILLVAWLLGALKPDQPQVALAVTGEQGSAKTTLCQIGRGVIDPNKCSARRPPKTEEDLFVAATSGLVVSIDNISTLPAMLSDSICSLTTGGGVAKRQLYTDGDEIILNAKCPVLLNGIENIVERPDLLDRSISLHLPAIPDSKRTEEESILRRFDDIHDGVLGCLLDAVSMGLRNVSKVKLKSLPRQADFTRWITACEPALPWEPGSFMEAYQANISAGNSAAVEGSQVATAIIALLGRTPTHEWSGSHSELLDNLDAVIDTKTAASKTWPRSARALSGCVERCRPNLRRFGITIIDMGSDSVTRRRILFISATKGEKHPSDASDASEPAKTNGFVPEGSPKDVQPPKGDASGDASVKNHQKSGFFDASEASEGTEASFPSFPGKKTINSALPQQSPLKSTGNVSKQPEIRPIQPVGSNGLFSASKTPDSDPVVVISNDGEGMTL